MPLHEWKWRLYGSFQFTSLRKRLTKMRWSEPSECRINTNMNKSFKILNTTKVAKLSKMILAHCPEISILLNAYVNMQSNLLFFQAHFLQSFSSIKWSLKLKLLFHSCSAHDGGATELHFLGIEFFIKHFLNKMTLKIAIFIYVAPMMEVQRNYLFLEAHFYKAFPK